MARVTDWCTAYHFFPLVKAKWLASPRLRTISFDAKLFCPWNVVNLTLFMEYKRKWHMPHLPYLFKRKSLLWTSLSSLCLGWNTFLITQIRTVKEGKDYGLQRLSCSDGSVLQSWVLWQWMHVFIPGLCSPFLTSLTSTPSRLPSPVIPNSFLFLKHARWPQSFCIHFPLELSSLQVHT